MGTKRRLWWDMTSIQYEIAQPYQPPTVTAQESGVYCGAKKVHITPALELVERIMREIRMTGKCGEFTGKWNGCAWEFRKCEPPEIARE